MLRSPQLSPCNKILQRTSQLWVCKSGWITAICTTIMASSVAADPVFESVGIPEAHYWEEPPGYQSAKPQASVDELLGPKPLSVSVDQLQNMQKRDHREHYRLLTDAQQARRDAERETIASRIGESNWHYGWGVGFEDVRLRLSYDF